MHALICSRLGGPEVLEYVELPDPVAGAGTVTIDVAAIGVNFPDGLVIAGKYQTVPDLPYVPGSEVAGTIRSIGADVVGLTPGQRVTAFCRRGGYAERVVVPAASVHPIPDAMPMTSAAALPIAYGTSYHGLVDRANLAAGETLLVLGAAGGVGLAAVEIGRAIGARVIAAASSAEKLALCESHGADVLINYRDEDLGAAIRARTEGSGVDVIYDPVGGPDSEAVLNRLAWGGRFVTVGFASGVIPRVGMNQLLLNERSLLGLVWGDWANRHPRKNSANMEQLMDWYRRGQLRPHIGGQWDLSAAAEALDSVMNRSALGKVVLTVGRNG